MRTKDLSFEDYIKSQKATKENTASAQQSIFERIANPSVDFLTGSQIIEDAEALAAAHRAGNEKATARGCRIKWQGTIGTVYKNGKIVETTKIHGMAWDRNNKTAHGLRMDISTIKDD
jgi:flagellar hook protein FlgE